MTFLINSVNDRLTKLKSEEAMLKHHNILAKEEHVKLNQLQAQIRDTQKFLDQLLEEEDVNNYRGQCDVDEC